MIIVIDNNIALDALLRRQPFSEAAERILEACADTHIGCLSVNSLTDIFYVLRKFIEASSAKKTIYKLMELLEIISLNDEDCINALSLPVDDFEDALAVICGEKIGADYIVTRDSEFLSINSSIPIVSPEKLLKMI